MEYFLAIIISIIILMIGSVIYETFNRDIWNIIHVEYFQQRFVDYVVTFVIMIIPIIIIAQIIKFLIN
jgi:hypothetical protein